MDVGIILAAGKGKRFKTRGVNKTASDFSGKPLLEYSLDLFKKTCDRTVVVVGVYSKSLRSIIASYPNTISVFQSKRLGTGHAVKVAIKKIITEGWIVDKIFVGYGDHMMFYSEKDLEKLKTEIESKRASLGIITCEHDPYKLAWGRILRDKDGNVDAIVEEKVATERQKEIRELNAGLYCLDFQFLKEGVFKIKKTPGGECYFTDIVSVAKSMGKKVVAVKIPFEHVGIGINTIEELEESQKIFNKLKRYLSSN